MAQGHIPWTAVNDYGREQDLDLDARDRLFLLIKSMDDTYLNHMEKQRQRDHKTPLKK
jgi:hypothetical protein